MPVHVDYEEKENDLPIREVVIRSDGYSYRAIKVQVDCGMFGFHFMSEDNVEFDHHDEQALNLKPNSVKQLIEALTALVERCDEEDEWIF